MCQQVSKRREAERQCDTQYRNENCKPKSLLQVIAGDGNVCKQPPHTENILGNVRSLRDMFSRRW